MKPEELSKSFSFLLDSLITWATSLRFPLKTARRLMGQAKSDLNAFKQASNLYLTAFLIGAVIQIPICQLYGISWSNAGFYLSTGLVFLLIIISFCAGIYFGLRIFKIPVSFVDLYVLYIALIGVFSPLYTLLSYPTLFKILKTMSVLKKQNANLIEIATNLFKNLQPESSSIFYAVYSAISGPMLMLFSFGMFAYLARILSLHLVVPKPKLFSALAFSFAVFCMIPTLLFSLFYYFILYAFL